MGYGLTNHLVGLSTLAIVACVFIACRRLPLSVALSVACFRVLLSTFYFAWYFDGGWTLIDDLNYFDRGMRLLEAQLTPLAFFTQHGRAMLNSVAESNHYLYTWWNLTTLWLFGPHYYVPVLCNVVITFLAAHQLGRWMQDLGFSPGYQRAVQIVYLLHWDVVAWSSILNLKDQIVQLFTISMILHTSRILKRATLRDGIWLVLLAALFQSLRFYIPFVIATSAAVWVFLQWRDVRKYPLLVMAGLVGLWLLPISVGTLFEGFSPFAVAFSIARFSLTPQPWSIEPTYSFLTYPALFHWIWFLPAVVGGLLLWRDSPRGRLAIVFAVTMICLYALADDIQGARQRAQLAWVFGWLPLHLVWTWTQAEATTDSPSRGAIQGCGGNPAQGMRPSM